MIYKSSLAYPLEPKWKPKKYPPKKYGTSPNISNMLPAKTKKSTQNDPPKKITTPPNSPRWQLVFQQGKIQPTPPAFQAAAGIFPTKLASADLMPPLAPTANPVFQDRYVERCPYLEDGILGLASVVKVTTPIYKPFSWPFGRGPTLLRGLKP